MCSETCDKIIKAYTKITKTSKEELPLQKELGE